MAYQPAERNYDGIQHEALRREVDPEFTVFHDVLSAAYYDGTVLDHKLMLDMGYKSRPIDFGALKTSNPDLAREIFELMHEGQEIKRQIKFHEINKNKPVEQQIPEEQYNAIREGETETPYQKNCNRVVTIGAILAQK